MDQRHYVTHQHQQFHLQQEISVQYAPQANYDVRRRHRIRQNAPRVVPQMIGLVHVMNSLRKLISSY